jgi:hypothetical protein
MTLIFRQQIQAFRGRKMMRLVQRTNKTGRAIGGNRALGYKG